MDALRACLADIWLRFSFGDLSAREAASQIVDAIAETTGAPCVLESESVGIVASRGDRAPTSALAPEAEPISARDGSVVGRLRFTGPHDAFDLPLVRALVARVLGPEAQAAAQLTHEINNRVAGLLANVELLELLLDGQTADTPLLANDSVDQRRDVLAAVANVGDVARGLARLVARRRHRGA